MLTLFLSGLLAVVGTIAIVTVAVLTILWLKNFIGNRLQNRNVHQVVFADTREVVKEYIKEKTDNSESMSIEDFERMCDKTPYVAANVDENGEVTDFEGVNPEDVDDRINGIMKQKQGFLLVED